MSDNGIGRREPALDMTLTQVRITRPCLARPHADAPVQPVQPGTTLTLPRYLCDQLVGAGKAQLLLE